MKYTIDGKSAYLVAKENGISLSTFYRRVKLGLTVKDTISNSCKNYIISKDKKIKFICFSTTQVAKYLGTTKGTICGLFFRQGDKIELFGYTIERRVRRENKTGANL